MKLIDTTIENFMSFGPEVTQSWEDIGLVLFEGVNNVAKSASSNGSGKTNLMESVIWAFYGQTTKGVGVDDVVNDIAKKGCKVTNRLGDPVTGNHWTITRTRKDEELGNSLIFKQIKPDGEIVDLSGVDMTATQDNISNFLGGGFTLFCNSTYFSQNNIKPFSLFTDKQIKDALVEALDLNRFFVALGHVRTDLKAVRTEFDMVTGKLARVEEERTEISNRLHDYETQEVGFKSKKRCEIEELNKKSDVFKKRIEAAELYKTRRGQLLKEIEEKMATTTESTAAADWEKVLESSKPLATNIRILETKYADIHRDFTVKKTEALNINRRVGTGCSECGKEITKEDVGSVLEATNAIAEKLRKKVEDMDLLITRAKGANSVYNERIEELEVELEVIASVRSEIEKHQKDLEEIKYHISIIPGLVLEMEEVVTAVELKEKEESPFSGLIHKEKTLLEESHPRETALKRLQNTKKDEIEQLEFLEFMFGYSGIPTFLLDSVVPFLNERSNHYATLVCEGEVQLSFSTTSRTKTGKIKEKFAIDVIHTSGAKKYKGISGGERKRADICIAQAMQDLCRSYGKNPLDIVFYDEPFEHLDSTGTAGVSEMLSAIQKELGTVAVVTHDDEMKSAFTNTITVVKDTDGYSRLVA